MSLSEKKTHLNRLLDQIDANNKSIRDKACRAILYIAQGVFAECDTVQEYHKNLTENVCLLYECDTFSIFIDLLLFEVELV